MCLSRNYIFRNKELYSLFFSLLLDSNDEKEEEIHLLGGLFLFGIFQGLKCVEVKLMIRYLQGDNERNNRGMKFKVNNFNSFSKCMYGMYEYMR